MVVPLDPGLTVFCGEAPHFRLPLLAVIDLDTPGRDVAHLVEQGLPLVLGTLMVSLNQNRQTTVLHSHRTQAVEARDSPHSGTRQAPAEVRAAEVGEEARERRTAGHLLDPHRLDGEQDELLFTSPVRVGQHGALWHRDAVDARLRVREPLGEAPRMLLGEPPGLLKGRGPKGPGRRKGVAIGVRQVKVTLAPCRAPWRRLRPKPPGRTCAYLASTSSTWKMTRTLLVEGGGSSALARFRDSVPTRNDVKASVSPP